MRRQNTAMSDSPAKKEGEPGSPEGKTFTTKAEYHRWLIQQEKWATAESIRQSGKEGEEMIKERQRKHTTAGLTRQQAAAVQMKKASESTEDSSSSIWGERARRENREPPSPFGLDLRSGLTLQG